MFVAGVGAACTQSATVYNCTRQNLTAIPSGIPQIVKSVLLQNNEITSVTALQFAPGSKFATQIGLDYNLLGWIGPGAFVNMTIGVLALNYNFITEIAVGAFMYVTMAILQLDHNTPSQTCIPSLPTMFFAMTTVVSVTFYDNRSVGGATWTCTTAPTAPNISNGGACRWCPFVATTTTTTTTPVSATSAQSVDGGAMAGLAVGGLVVGGVCAGLAMRRRRRSVAAAPSAYLSLHAEEDEPELYENRDGIAPVSDEGYTYTKNPMFGQPDPMTATVSPYYDVGAVEDEELYGTLDVRSFSEMHTKCVSGLYTSSAVVRGEVPAGKEDWSTEFADYAPVEYTAPVVAAGPVWADGPEKPADSPRNPVGRTGVVGRGLLGKWGPNKAADPIVSRVYMEDGTMVHDDVLIKRGGSSGAGEGEWAIPGGMVDAKFDGGKISATLAREFTEEALAAHAPDTDADVAGFFAAHGHLLYSGYVDDIRNTDDAWMVSEVWGFWDLGGKFLKSCGFDAGTGRTYAGGDDATHVKLVRYTPGMKLFASHAEFLRLNHESIVGHL